MNKKINGRSNICDEIISNNFETNVIYYVNLYNHK